MVRKLISVAAACLTTRKSPKSRTIFQPFYFAAWNDRMTSYRTAVGDHRSS